MNVVYCILGLFLAGWIITGLSRLSWYKPIRPTKEERHMSHKAKFPVSKSRAKAVVHLDYLRVYHELLKYEDVLDIDIDSIYEAVVDNINRKLAKAKLNTPPDPSEIEIIIKEVMDKLTGTYKKETA